MSLIMKSQSWCIANDSEGFQKLGEVIGITEYSIEIKADDLYNYTLEVRDGGILIKPSNQKSYLQKTIELK